MTELAYATPPDATRLPFKDRRTSLRVAGVLLVVLGAISGCFGAMTPLGMIAAAMAPRPATMPGAGAPAAAPFQYDFRTMAVAGAMYVIAAALFIWAGVGSLRLRRWAKPVMLVLGWSWLVTGVGGTVYWLVGTPSMQEMMATSVPPGSPRPPPGVVKAIAWGTGVFMTLFMVGVPALLVWVFSRRGVYETVQYFDPRVRWTDACPTPVLAVSAWLAVAALGCLVYCAYGVMPVFGLILSGVAGVAGLVLMAAVFVTLSWLCYRRRPAGWWGTLVIFTLWSASMVWTFSRISWEEFYRRAGYTPQQIDAILRYSGPYESGSLWMMAFWAVALIGYLLYVRRYFAPAAPAAA